ncbi:MAG TPA: hypothetical protein ENI33_04250 [Thermoplasmatales archaeon]|nr:hypothetical protein [Thermoplasmatales archaeon]
MMALNLFRRDIFIGIIVVIVIANSFAEINVVRGERELFQQNDKRFSDDKNPQILWWYDLDAPSFGSSAVDDIDADGKPEIVFGTYFNDEKIYALNAENGTLLWSYYTGGCNDASVAIADVDQDNELEVIAPSSATLKIYCFDGETGNVEWETYTGYPNCIDSPPAVADVDNDGKPEVIFGTWYDYVFSLNGEDGSVCWQVNVGTDSYIQSGPNILDIDGDGDLDVVVAQFAGDCRVYALKGDDGSTLWYSDLPQDYMYHGGSFADIDEDGRLEIVIGCYDKNVYVLNCEDGSLVWSYTAPYYVAAPTSIADLNNDAHLEIIFASYNIIGVLSYTGNLIWSYTTGGTIFRGGVIADVNGDGTPDVVFGSEDGILRVLKGDSGEEIWTYDLQSHYGNTYEIDHAPVITDFNNDGKLDIFVVGGYGTSNPPTNNHGRAYALSAGNGTGKGWKMFRYNLFHSGFYPNLPPAILNVEANPTSQVPNEYVNITCTVTDDVAVNSVMVNITYPEGFTVNHTMERIDGTNDYYFNTTYSSVGTYSYFIWANDTGGNSNISSTYTFNIKDAVKPEIKNIVDFPDPQQIDEWVNISCVVTDNVGVAEVKINISYPNGLKINVTMSNVNNKYYYNESYHVAGFYTYFIWAIDSSGNINKSSTYTFAIENIPYALYLYKGWNLITLPCENSYNASSLFNDINGCSIILGWNASIDDFNLYVPGSPYDFAIENGHGYFIGMSHDSIFSLADIPIENVSVPLYIGWNILGWFNSWQTNASSLYNAIDNCTLVLSWNASMQDFDLYAPGVPDDFVVARGDGFMIAVDEESIWHGEG